MDLKAHKKQSDEIAREIHQSVARIIETNGLDKLDLDFGAAMAGYLRMYLAHLALDMPEVMARLQQDGLIKYRICGEPVLDIPAFLRRQTN